MDAGADSYLVPGPVGCIYGSFQSEAERKTSAVSERQAKRARFCNQIARQPGVLRGKGHSFTDRAERGFPGIVGREAPADEFAVDLGEIDGAGGRSAQKFGRELFDNFRAGWHLRRGRLTGEQGRQ